ncbi:MAG: ABC transporter ATP-binding protein [Thermoplasmatota archaeon]
MIEVRDLGKYYGDFEAIKNITFTINEGEVFSLLGSNGAGKTTIIKAIAGLLEPTRGFIRINQSDINNGYQVKKLYGYMPEQPHLYDRLTGREFLEMMGSLRGINENILSNKIDDFAVEMEIDHMLNSEMGAYSKGMKQKILFANAIIHDPPNLILDEPTTGLDPRFTKYLKRKIREQADMGKGVLMSTHITSVAEEISDRIAIIDCGKFVAQGTLEELLSLTNSETLEDVFVEVIHNERKGN